MTPGPAEGAAPPVRPYAVVDARGLRCPLPVIRLASAARGAGPGDQLVVWATDPAARHDIPAWARMRGHAVVDDAAAPRPDDGPADVVVVAVRLGAVRVGAGQLGAVRPD